MEKREYVLNKKPAGEFSKNIEVLNNLDDQFWKGWIFYYLLEFYKNHNAIELKEKIKKEKQKLQSNIEKLIAKYIRKYLRQSEFSYNFDVNGESETDTNVLGFYDIKISNTYWNGKKYFPFECKNLDKSQDLINKYVYYDKGHKKFDGGVYRYFNGKYAQDQNFGGMLGFVLDGNVNTIKEKIKEKLKTPFDISLEGDLRLPIIDNSIMGNDFTFDSIHNRKGIDFTLHHILFDFH